eukprot:COSAG06_NODE_5244_length_3613_cov_2.953330_2_plen_371_part_00
MRACAWYQLLFGRYISGDIGWAMTSATIHVLSGGLMGLVFANNLVQGHFGVRVRWCFAYPVGLAVGLPGLAKAAATFTVGVCAHDVERAMQTQLPIFEITALTASVLPVAVLKAYVGNVDGWSKLILASLFVSVLGAGVSVFQWEALARDDAADLRLWSRYGTVVIMLRATQAAVLLLCITVLGCTAKGLAALALAVGLCSYCGLTFEPTFRVSRAALKVAALCSLCFMAVICGVVAAVVYIAPSDNNHANATMQPAPPGHPQHLDCRDIHYEALAAAVAVCLVFTPLSWVLDPLVGVQGWRAASWKEQLVRGKFSTALVCTYKKPNVCQDRLGTNRGKVERSVSAGKRQRGPDRSPDRRAQIESCLAIR